MKNKKTISLYINSNEITVSQFNDIIGFASTFATKNPNQIEIIVDVDKFPFRLKGKISNLTSLARDYFWSWNKSDKIRNISLAEDA